MITNAIAKWISGSQDYWEGVKLYDTYGSSESFTNLFKAGPTNYSIAKLLEKLSDLRKETASHPAIKTNSLVDLPDDLKELYNQACAELNEMKFLHPKLELLNSDAQRFNTALKLQKLHISQRFKFNIIDEYINTGKRIEMPVPIVKRRKLDYSEMNNLELAYQLQYLPQYIGKCKSKLKNTTDQEELIKLNSMIDQYNEDIENVKKILSGEPVSN